MSRGRRGSMPSNNNSICRDERLGIGACDRTLSPTNNMKSGSNSGIGYTGVGNENDSSPINSPASKKKKGVFIYCCAYSLYINYLLFIFLILTINIPNIKNSTQFSQFFY